MSSMKSSMSFSVCLYSSNYDLDQGSAIFFCKGQRVNILGFSGLMVCHNYSTLFL